MKKIIPKWSQIKKCTPLTTPSFRLIFFALTLILSSTQGAYADHSVEHTENPPESNTGTYLRVGGFCMGGAVLGSIVPIFGNIAGCAIGALGGWFVNSLGDSDDESEITDADQA